jgi:hypothetical protein
MQYENFSKTLPIIFVFRCTARLLPKGYKCTFPCIPWTTKTLSEYPIHDEVQRRHRRRTRTRNEWETEKLVKGIVKEDKLKSHVGRNHEPIIAPNTDAKPSPREIPRKISNLYAGHPINENHIQDNQETFNLKRKRIIEYNTLHPGNAYQHQEGNQHRATRLRTQVRPI